WQTSGGSVTQRLPSATLLVPRARYGSTSKGEPDEHGKATLRAGVERVVQPRHRRGYGVLCGGRGGDRARASGGLGQGREQRLLGQGGLPPAAWAHAVAGARGRRLPLYAPVGVLCAFGALHGEWLSRSAQLRATLEITCVLRRSEPELCVQAMRIGGVQHPEES